MIEGGTRAYGCARTRRRTRGPQLHLKNSIRKRASAARDSQIRLRPRDDSAAVQTRPVAIRRSVRAQIAADLLRALEETDRTLLTLLAGPSAGERVLPAWRATPGAPMSYPGSVGCLQLCHRVTSAGSGRAASRAAAAARSGRG